MKVAILSPYPTAPFSKVLNCESLSYLSNATWTVTLARMLSKIPNVEVHVITETDNIPTSKTIDVENVHVHFIRAPKKHKTLTFWQFNRMRILKELFQIKPDIVHAQGIETQYGYVAVTSPYPNVVTIHGLPRLRYRAFPPKLFSRGKIVQLLESYSMRRVKNIIVINPFAIDVYNLKKKTYNLFHIPNAVSEECFNSSTIQRQENEIVAVGTIEHLKGFDILLKAVTQLKRRGIESKVSIIGQAVAGMSRYREGLDELISAHNLDVRFLGFLPPSEVIARLRSCAILVHPSRHEHAPMAVAEALSTGTPVVASAVGGIPHMFQNGISGLLFEKNNIDELAKHIEKLLADLTYRKQLGEAGQDLARNNYHPKHVALKTYEAYRSILNDH